MGLIHMSLPNDLHRRAMALAPETPPGTLVGLVTRAVRREVERLEAEREAVVKDHMKTEGKKKK